MNFKAYKEKKIAAAEVASRAECLAAMDCLMHHMNDEDGIAYWLQACVPDSGNWRSFENAGSEPGDRRGYYEDLARNMTYGDYEACVKLFAYISRAQCFSTKYTPGAFT